MLKHTQLYKLFFFILSINSANADIFVTTTSILEHIEQSVSVDIGLAIYDAETNKEYNFNGYEYFPMMSVVKSLVCANLLSDADFEPELLKRNIMIEEKALVVWSPVTQPSVGTEMNLFDACEASMLTSDNTAINIVLSQIGGPAGVTEFLRQLGDNRTRLDRIEPELNRVMKGDQRDSTTPLAIIQSLQTLYSSDLLSDKAKKQWLKWMDDNTVSGDLIRSMLPKKWVVGDRTGAGGEGSRSLIAVLRQKGRQPIYLSVFLAHSELTIEQRNRLVNLISQIALNVIGIEEHNRIKLISP